MMNECGVLFLLFFFFFSLIKCANLCVNQVQTNTHTHIYIYIYKKGYQEVSMNSVFIVVEIYGSMVVYFHYLSIG
jgi:hypothetical protein